MFWPSPSYFWPCRKLSPTLVLLPSLNLQTFLQKFFPRIFYISLSSPISCIFPSPEAYFASPLFSFSTGDILSVVSVVLVCWRLFVCFAAPFRHLRSLPFWHLARFCGRVVSFSYKGCLLSAGVIRTYGRLLAPSIVRRFYCSEAKRLSRF